MSSFPTTPSSAAPAGRIPLEQYAARVKNYDRERYRNYGVGSGNTDPSTGITSQWENPALIGTDQRTTIPYLLNLRLQRDPNGPIIDRKEAIGSAWRPMSTREFVKEVRETARGLMGMGLEAGEAVAIMSHTRYEWALLDFACWYAGLLPIPIYETSSADQIRFILADSGVRMVVAEDLSMAELVRGAAREISQDVQVLSLDSQAISTIISAGSQVSDQQLDERTNMLTASSVATVVYTSGTTGTPKGTTLTHGNFTVLAVNSHPWMPTACDAHTRLLMFLPLAHVLARFLQVYVLTSQGVLGHAPNLKNLLADLQSFKPTWLLVVPRVLEKIYNAADAEAGASGKRRIFHLTAKAAIDYSKALDAGKTPSTLLKAGRWVSNLAVYGKIRKLLGGNVEYAISGGAPLSPRLAHFFTGLGVPIYEGYGLTETVGPISVNLPTHNRVGTVGPILPSMAVRISPAGEVQIKGPSVFTGYRGNEEATREAFTEDGWFRSGDLGSIDVDGYLTITGRMKDVIVTAGGKNVVPSVLEDALSSHPLISQIVVAGDQRPFISALITLDEEMLPMWLKSHNLPAMSVQQASKAPEVLDSLQRAVDKANASVSRAESIRKFLVLDTDFTEAEGLLTPSLKVKRKEVLKRFASTIDTIYGGPVQDI